MSIDINRFQEEFIKRSGKSIVGNNYPKNFSAAKFGNDVVVFQYNPSNGNPGQLTNQGQVVVRIKPSKSYSKHLVNFNGIDEKDVFTSDLKNSVSIQFDEKLISIPQRSYLQKVSQRLENSMKVINEPIKLYSVVFGQMANKILLLKARDAVNGLIDQYQFFNPAFVSKKEISKSFYDYVFTEEQIEMMEKRIELNSDNESGNAVHDKSTFRVAKLKAETLIEKYGISTKYLKGVAAKNEQFIN